MNRLRRLRKRTREERERVKAEIESRRIASLTVPQSAVPTIPLAGQKATMLPVQRSPRYRVDLFPRNSALTDEARGRNLTQM
jgi:hypothetical protein